MKRIHMSQNRGQLHFSTRRNFTNGQMVLNRRNNRKRRLSDSQEPQRKRRRKSIQHLQTRTILTTSNGVRVQEVPRPNIITSSRRATSVPIEIETRHDPDRSDQTVTFNNKPAPIRRGRGKFSGTRITPAGRGQKSVANRGRKQARTISTSLERGRRSRGRTNNSLTNRHSIQSNSRQKVPGEGRLRVILDNHTEDMEVDSRATARIPLPYKPPPPTTRQHEFGQQNGNGLTKSHVPVFLPREYLNNILNPSQQTVFREEALSDPYNTNGQDDVDMRSSRSVVSGSNIGLSDRFESMGFGKR